MLHYADHRLPSYGTNYFVSHSPTFTTAGGLDGSSSLRESYTHLHAFESMQSYNTSLAPPKAESQHLIMSDWQACFALIVGLELACSSLLEDVEVRTYHCEIHLAAVVRGLKI